MRFKLVIAAGLACVFVLSSAGSAKAQSSLRARDRLLLYYHTYYRAQKERETLFDAQSVFRSNLGKFRQEFYSNQYTPLADSSPYDRYIREGRMDQPRRRPLPPIYRGQGGQTQYFMRFNYFNTPTGIRRN